MNISEIIKQPDFNITIAGIGLFTAGILSLARWLIKTSLGRKALLDSVPRRNNMTAFMPFIPLFIWFGSITAAVSITDGLLTRLPDWQKAAVNNLILCIGALIATAVIIFLAKTCFARQLKGFGLDIKTMPRDFFAAAANLVSAWPLVILTIVLTMVIGQFIWGKDFRIEQHEELKLIATYSQLPVRVLVIIATTVIAPIFEEMLFRGLFQTMIRSILVRPWLSIALCSAFFAIVHQNPAHWPALFVLSMCLGYSYEKSGSLFRPIFIHLLFNAVGIISVLSCPP
jgi:membrane protease YdiL (CAAX protease family)